MNISGAHIQSYDDAKALFANPLPIARLRAVLKSNVDRLDQFTESFLGYPISATGASTDVEIDKELEERLLIHTLVQLGTPEGNKLALSIADMEMDVLNWFKVLFKCKDWDQYTGYVTTGGSEGNIEGVHVGLSKFSDATLVYSSEAHYSVSKAGLINKVPKDKTCVVASTASGAIDTAALDVALSGLRQNGVEKVVVLLTNSTTMRGGNDNIKDALSTLEDNGYGFKDRHVHVDGALGALVSILAEEYFDIAPTFDKAISSVSCSGHKFLSVEIPCGMFVGRKKDIEYINTNVQYVSSNDMNIAGSRPGSAVYKLWKRIMKWGFNGYAEFVKESLIKSEWVKNKLSGAGMEVYLNECSITVYFPKPSEEIVAKYNLATEKKTVAGCEIFIAHIVVMIGATSTMLDGFVTDMIAYHKAQTMVAPWKGASGVLCSRTGGVELMRTGAAQGHMWL